MNFQSVFSGRTFQRLLALAAFMPALAAAQATPPADAGSSSSSWKYSLSVYGYFPSLGGSGSTSVPTSVGGPTIDVSAGKIIDSLKFTFMGAFDVNNGRWGAFTDIIYLDLGGNKFSRDFTLNRAPVGLNTAANLDWDLKGTLWTVGGEYRMMSEPVMTLDLLAGARMFNMKPTLSWNIIGDAPGVQPVGRFGSSETSDTVWDGIVGVKGRYAVGSNGRWSLPFYFDAGTGQSKLTWQAAAGVSYAYPWGELTAMWRYLSYDMKSGAPIDNLHFNGPMVGATVRW